MKVQITVLGDLGTISWGGAQAPFASHEAGKIIPILEDISELW